MNTAMTFKKWSESAAVAIATVGAAALFFEIIRSRLPDASTTWLIVAATGIALLAVGVGVLSVSGFRLLAALKRPDATAISAAAKDHLGCSLLVLAGFVLSVVALLALF
jgi:hypothetical protein